VGGICGNESFALLCFPELCIGFLLQRSLLTAVPRHVRQKRIKEAGGGGGGGA